MIQKLENYMKLTYKTQDYIELYLILTCMIQYIKNVHKILVFV